MLPRIAIVGHKNSGKTTLVERLIAAFASGGLKVAAIKHTSDERGFDEPDSDSDHLMRAGATSVGMVARMVARSEVGFYTTRGAGASEAGVEAALGAMPMRPDLLIYEGFRDGGHPKIECILDPTVTTPTVTVEAGLLAVVADHAVTASVPVLADDPLEPIIGMIRERIHPGRWPTVPPALTPME
jgi:molybdopterin-guanine dinucleotide biosynthesis protein MobB